MQLLGRIDYSPAEALPRRAPDLVAKAGLCKKYVQDSDGSGKNSIGYKKWANKKKRRQRNEGGEGGFDDTLSWDNHENKEFSGGQNRT